MPIGAKSWAVIMRCLTLALCGALLIASAKADNPDFDFSDTVKNAADYFVDSLPGAPEPLLRSYAGHIEVTPEHHGNLFFWLFKNRHIADRNRLVIWLNGGPGCSSMDGAMMEIGPYRVNDNGTLRIVDGSWDEFANVVFVDNPVGTGFSYVEGNAYLHELNEMADNMITFLEEFFRLFPEHARDDIYIAGESYAGQHIPYVAQAILDRNAKGGMGDRQHWNLSGLLIGNGWISGPEQYPSYLKFVRENGLLQAGSDDDKILQEQQKACDAALAKGGAQHVDTNVCEGILTEFLRLSQKDNQCYNMYDVRLRDKYPSCGMTWPPDLKNLTPYLRRRDVTRALHLNIDKQTGWKECNDQVSSTFRAKNSKPSRELLPGLLKEMPIILFSGDKDLICNHIGTEDMISQMEWNGGKGMELSPGTWAPRRDWTFESEPAGFYQSARNLTYIRFYNSSHMVPFDYPRRTRDMLDRFMGVDIASIGGRPADSRIDGEKGLDVSVGGHPNSTAAAAAEKDKIRAAKWAAYRRSGEVALVFALIAAGAWGVFVWRERRRRKGYRSVYGVEDGNGTPMASGLGLDNVPRRKWQESSDLEAAREFDEAELDDLTHEGKVAHQPQFGLADDDDEDDEHDANGKEAKRHGV